MTEENPDASPSVPAAPLGYTVPPPPPAPPPPAAAVVEDKPAPPEETKPKGRKRKVTAKRAETDELDDLKATVRQQSQQISALMTMLANQSNQPEVDLSQTPYERERVASHEAQKEARRRTPERDADPAIVWTGTHYQARETVHGMVPIEMVETLKANAPIRLPETPEQALEALRKKQKSPIQEICNG